GAKEWNNSLKTKLSLLPKKLFRIRMSCNFGMKMLTMTNLSTECLIQLTKLGYDATPFNQILKQNAKREMRLRLGKVTVADVLRLFLLVLILLLMPTLNFLPVWFALSLLRFRLPSRLPMMFILWMVAMMVVIIPSRTV